MHSIAPTEYIVTEVMTAPPQKLQLMLIEAALRFAAKAKNHWHAAENAEAGEAILRCQQIVSAIIAGVRPDADRALASKVSAIYAFVFRCLVAAHLRSDGRKLDEAISVLQIERETWQLLCGRLEDRRPAAHTGTTFPGAGLSLQA
jgi:flagellar secretion chaperone FliS